MSLTTFNFTRKGDADHSEKVSQMLAHHVARTLGRQELFVLQYTKLCNYFGSELSPQWGGNYLDHQSHEILKLGMIQFLTDVNKVSAPEAQWIRRKNPYDNWRIENLEVGTSPPDELGARYEPYIAHRGVMIKLQYAARLLAIPHLELLQLKLNLLVDSLVIQEAILRMLRPRPLWPEVVVKAGNLNKVQGAIDNVQQDPQV